MVTTDHDVALQSSFWHTQVMNTKRVLFAGLSILLPDDWQDVTDDLPTGSPFTLGKIGNDALGALQFSVAKYKRGPLPSFTKEKLELMIMDFFRAQSLGEPHVITTSSNKIILAKGDFQSEAKYSRIWYVSDRQNIVLVTYTSLQVKSPQLKNEVDEADAIVNSIEFS